MSSVTCGSWQFLTIERMFWAVSRKGGRKQRPAPRLAPPTSVPDPGRAPGTSVPILVVAVMVAGRARARKRLDHRSPRPAAPLTRSPAASTPSCESVAKPVRLPPLSPKSALFWMVENHCRKRFRKMPLYEWRPGVSQFSGHGGKQPHTPIHGFFSGIKHNILGRNSV